MTKEQILDAIKEMSVLELNKGNPKIPNCL